MVNVTSSGEVEAGEPVLDEGETVLKVDYIGEEETGQYGRYSIIGFETPTGHIFEEPHSLKLSSQSKLGELYVAAMGDLPEAGEEVDLDDLVGKVVRAVIEHKESEDGEFTNAKVVTYLEAEAGEDEDEEEIPF